MGTPPRPLPRRQLSLDIWRQAGSHWALKREDGLQSVGDPLRCSIVSAGFAASRLASQARTRRYGPRGGSRRAGPGTSRARERRR